MQAWPLSFKRAGSRPQALWPQNNSKQTREKKSLYTQKITNFKMAYISIYMQRKILSWCDFTSFSFHDKSDSWAEVKWMIIEKVHRGLSSGKALHWSSLLHTLLFPSSMYEASNLKIVVQGHCTWSWKSVSQLCLFSLQGNRLWVLECPLQSSGCPGKLNFRLPGQHHQSHPYLARLYCARVWRAGGAAPARHTNPGPDVK